MAQSPYLRLVTADPPRPDEAPAVAAFRVNVRFAHAIAFRILGRQAKLAHDARHGRARRPGVVHPDRRAGCRGAHEIAQAGADRPAHQGRPARPVAAEPARELDRVVGRSSTTVCG